VEGVDCKQIFFFEKILSHGCDYKIYVEYNDQRTWWGLGVRKVGALAVQLRPCARR